MCDCDHYSISFITMVETTVTSQLQLSNISSLLTNEILYEVGHLVYKKKHGREAPAINKYNISFACRNGDGYLGTIYRITAQFMDGQHISVIGKGLPVNIARRVAFQCENFFRKEIYFYTTIVPEFRKFEKQENSLLAIPECFYAVSDGKNDFLLLEDLSEDGYEMTLRYEGLKYDKIQSVIKMLARFHSLSFVMKYFNTEMFNNISCITEPIFSLEQSDWFEKYLLKLSELFIESIKDSLEGTEYLRKFKEFVNPKTFYNSMIATVDNKEECVICHGDTWIANFMFQHVDVKFLDFQLVRCGSPILDVATAIFSCTEFEDRAMCGGTEGILKLYHEELSRVVTSYDTPVPFTMHTLYDMWRRLGVHGLGCAVELALLALAEDVEDLDRWNQEVTLVDLVQFPPITSQRGKQRLVDLIKLAVDEGLI